MLKPDITAIILTKNEEDNIADCIKSISNICKRIVVVDSFSDDNTEIICKELGVEFYKHEFINYARQYDAAIDIANISTKWILKFDADERLTEESREELKDLCHANSDTDINGIELRFKRIFMNKCLLHGGIYPWRKLSCYKTQCGHIENKEMDEHIVVEGKTIRMKCDSLHMEESSIDKFIIKHINYANREARDYFSFYSLRKSYNFKDWIKCNIYYRLPLGLRAYLYYFYRFYMRLGFLDGKEGHIYAFIQAYWYRFLVDTKIYEMKNKK